MTTTDSTARSYFDSFAGDRGLERILALPSANPATVESEWLDFKSGQPQASSVRPIISKALGAFGNNAGGVLIWGLDCRKDENGIDHVIGTMTAPNVDDLMQQLTEQYRTVTQPSVVGVEFKALTLRPDTKEGFVVMYIPAGAHKPYRSLNAKFPYYIRIGGHSHELPHEMLRQLFYPASSTEATLTVTFTKEPMGIGDNAIRFSFVLTNVGQYTMKNPCIAVQSADVKLLVGLQYTIMGSMPSFIELAAALHPSMSATFSVVVPLDSSYSRATIEILLYQEHQPVSSTKFEFDLRRPEFYHPTECLDDRQTLTFDTVE